MTDQEFIREIAQGNNDAFTALYTQYHSEFFGYMRKRYNGDSDTIVDLYQESCIVLYDRICSGKLHTLNPGAKLKTYLFKVGNNKLIDLIRKGARIGTVENIGDAKDCDSGYDDERSEQFAMIQQAVNMMTEPCNTILTLYYWDAMSHDEIAKSLGYANADSAKAQKSKCMNKLKSYVKTLL